jgi:hypothetical protein
MPSEEFEGGMTGPTSAAEVVAGVETTPENGAAETIGDLESFTVPFEEYPHTIEISSEADYAAAAEKLTALGYRWNGGADLTKGITNPLVHPPLKLIIGEDKIVTWILPGSTTNY